MTDVSVIVVAFDVRDDVLNCLGSIQRHAGALEVEAVLVDNASRDGTAEAVAHSHPWVRVIQRPTNEGVAARNHGLRSASGRYRMFLDSDAELTDGALPELVRFMDERPDIGLVGPRLVYPDGTLQPSARRFPPLLLPLMRRGPWSARFESHPAVCRHLMADFAHDETRDVEYVLGACQLFRADAQACAGELDPRYFFGPDDAEWCFQIRRAGWRVCYHPGATVIHRYRRSTSRRQLSRTALKHLTSFYRFQWRWRRDRSRLIDPA